MIFSRLSPLLRIPLVASLTRDSLLRMDPEIAHGATINALRLGLAPEQDGADPPELKTTLAGLELTNPIGMAAGFDKNGEVPRPLALMGFGMVEVGTVTPLPATGQSQAAPVPHCRPPKASSTAWASTMRATTRSSGACRASAFAAALGVNIGANKTSEDFVADYVQGVARFADIADYLTVNISSPNTPGLRNLQQDEALLRLLRRVLAARAKAQVRVPVFLKIAPDLDETAMDAIAKVIATTDLDGLIVSNTTITRDAVAGHGERRQKPAACPASRCSTCRPAVWRRCGSASALPIIGVGGIHSPQSALAKFEAGANAIQLYSALVFGGLDLLERIKRGLAAAVRAEGKTNIAELVGRQDRRLGRRARSAREQLRQLPARRDEEDRRARDEEQM